MTDAVHHEALISQADFDQARAIASAGARRPVKMKRRSTGRPYLLSGLLVCALCGRRMQGSWNHERAHYRCKFPSKYASLNAPEHPKTVYVREAAIVPALDAWLSERFDDEHREETLEALAAAREADTAGSSAAAAARRTIADCEERLARYALEAGTDPALIAQWTAEVQAEKLTAEGTLPNPSEIRRPADIERTVCELGAMVTLLEEADPTIKARLYREMNLRLEYQPAERVVGVELRLPGACTTERVGGASHTDRDWRLAAWWPTGSG